MKTVPHFFTAKSGRVYVELADVAAACGLAAREIDFKYRPDAWACPRDFTWEHGRMWLAPGSLPQLVDALFEAGLGDAAILLRTQVAAWVEASTSMTTTREPASANKGGKAAPASESWLNRWEKEHDA